MLDGEAENQAAIEITRITHVKVERALERYRTNIMKSLNIPEMTLKELRKDFIYYSLLEPKKPGIANSRKYIYHLMYRMGFHERAFRIWSRKRNSCAILFASFSRLCIIYSML
jgi:hypothetical protein